MARSAAILLPLLLAACSGPPALNPIPPDGVILAFGDSLTHGTGVPGDQSYPAVLEELTGRRVIRSGVPGEISSRGRQRLSAVLQETTPDLVVICHGGNDVLRRLPSSNAEANLRVMISMAREAGAEVAVIAVPHFGLFPEPLPFFEDLQATMQVPVELSILADLQSDNAMKSDQVHFNRAGYRRMAEAVNALLIRAGAL